VNKTVLKLAQILVTLALLALVFYQVGLFSETGRAEFAKVLVNVSWPFLLLSVAVGVLINASSALKWFMLTRSQNLGASYPRIFAYYLVGQFYNLFLPTSVGGDVVRAYELGKFSGRQADSLASVFVERYTGVLTLLFVAGLAILSQISLFSVDFVRVSLIAFALGLSFIAWMLLDQRLYRWVRDSLTARIPITDKLFTKLDKLLLSIDSYKQKPSAIVWAFVNSLIFYLIAVLNVLVTAWVFQADVSWWPILIATPIIMLIMNIPLSFGNIGLMEFAYTSMFQLMGYDPALGLSVALLMRLKSLFDGAMGGLLHPLFVTQKHE